MPEVFAELEQALRSSGPTAAVTVLCDRLRERKDFGSLFYALLMKKRVELGIPPIPTGPASDIPPQHHAAYEEGIRLAAREVGQLYLRDGDLGQAWSYYRMLGEPGPVRDALEKWEPGPDDDVQAAVQIGLYEGVHPSRGFDLLLSRYGICSAITTLSQLDPSQQAPEARQYCLRAIVRALYEELRDRLTAEVERQEGKLPPEAEGPRNTPGVVRKLLAGRDYLFAEDCYHIDTSHLSSVVQMSVHLQPCEEMGLARELCDYGRRLSGRFQHGGDPPFEDLYGSHDAYLAILSGEDVEKNLSYFRKQAADADPDTVGTYPAEVLVNLFLRLERPGEALAVARQYLANVDNRRLSCPSIAELCQRVKDYKTLAEVAREQGDPVHFLAGLLAAK